MNWASGAGIGSGSGSQSARVTSTDCAPEVGVGAVGSMLVRQIAWIG